MLPTNPLDLITTIVFPGPESIVVFCVCANSTDKVQSAHVTYDSALHNLANWPFGCHIVKVIGTWPSVGQKLFL